MSGYHDAHFTEHPTRAAVWQAIAAYLEPHVPPEAHVLELGAGYCHWINHVRAARRVAVDQWAELPRHAAPGVETAVFDLRGGLGSLGRSAFDVVLASNLLEHFDPDAAAALVGQVRDVLKPGGRLIVIQPNFRYAWFNYFDDYTHRAIFTDVSLPAMLRSQGFSIETVQPRFLPYSMRDRRIPFARWLVGAYLRAPLRLGAGQMLVIATRETPDVR
jgi:SAM-dependent methyltransferase